MFMLCLELIDLLKHSAPKRSVNVTSSFYKRGKIDFDNLQGKPKYSAMALTQIVNWQT